MIPMLRAVNYYHKALHLECCSSPRSVSESTFPGWQQTKTFGKKILQILSLL